MHFELGPDLLKAIAPNINPKNAQVKFDDAGTLHVLERGSDGKLIKDYALKNIEEKIHREQGNSKKEDLLLKKNDNKESRQLYLGILLSFVVMIFECSYFVFNGGAIETKELITILFTVILSLALLIFCFARLCFKYFKR